MATQTPLYIPTSELLRYTPQQIEALRRLLQAPPQPYRSPHDTDWSRR